MDGQAGAARVLPPTWGSWQHSMQLSQLPPVHAPTPLTKRAHKRTNGPASSRSPRGAGGRARAPRGARRKKPARSPQIASPAARPKAHGFRALHARGTAHGPRRGLPRGGRRDLGAGGAGAREGSRAPWDGLGVAPAREGSEHRAFGPYLDCKPLGTFHAISKFRHRSNLGSPRRSVSCFLYL